MLLDDNNPAIDVTALMEKIQREIDGRTVPRAAWSAAATGLPPDAVASFARIEAALDSAEEKSRIRTRWSGRLNRFPFNAFPGLQTFFLKILAFVFRDQRHVNFALLAALRETLTMNSRLSEQVDQLRTRVNVISDLVNENVSNRSGAPRT